mgnify:CR=1 FL=1
MVFNIKRYSSNKQYATIKAMKKTIPLSKRTVSYQAHRRQFIWQILIPIIVALLLVIAASVVAATRNSGTASLWADISMIWLLIPVLFFSFLFFILLAGLIYALAVLLKITPNYTYQVQQMIYRVKQAIKRGADFATKPVFFIEEISARIKRIFRDQ